MRGGFEENQQKFKYGESVSLADIQTRNLRDRIVLRYSYINVVCQRFEMEAMRFVLLHTRTISNTSSNL
jgi:hypothetical protein